MTNPFLFLVGCSRSGTTLLQHVVASHPQIGVIPETRWFARWFEKQYGVTPEGFITADLVSQLLQQHRLFRDIDLGIQPAELYNLVGSGRTTLYADFVSFLFNRYGEVRGKPLVGNKTPGYVRRLATLHSLWPQAKFVHIIRDGRDVHRSVMVWKKVGNFAKRFATWDEDPVTTSALWWERNVRLGREIGSTFGAELYYELRYEALVTNPEAACAALCAFLDVPYDDAMLRHHEGEVKMAATLELKHTRVRQPITPGLRDWRKEMAEEDVAQFEAAAGDMLDELGYPRGAAVLSRQALAHAARLRNQFEERPLPQRWQPATMLSEAMSNE